MKIKSRSLPFKVFVVVAALAGFFLAHMDIGYAAEEHGGHGSKELDATKTFTPEELSKLKPEEICMIHKCSHGTCLILSGEAAKLGKCPQCGEDLGNILRAVQEIASAKVEGRSLIALTPEKQQYLGVKLGAVERRRLTKEIYTVGRIAYDPDLYVAQREFKAALATLEKVEQGPLEEPKEFARSNVEAIKRRLRILGLSDDQIRQMEAHPHEDTSLILPGSTEGVWVYAPVYEYELGYIKIGQEILVKVPAFPDKEFKGAIQSIDAVLDPLTRTARVRALLENKDGLLRPEMYANSTIKIDLGKGLAVPSDAIFRTGKENIIFVSLGEGRFEPRSVVTGLEGAGFTEIKSGLAEGERVVTSGNFLIDSESRLKAALGAMGGHQHGQ